MTIREIGVWPSVDGESNTPVTPHKPNIVPPLNASPFMSCLIAFTILLVAQSGVPEIPSVGPKSAAKQPAAKSVSKTLPQTTDKSPAAKSPVPEEPVDDSVEEKTFGERLREIFSSGAFGLLGDGGFFMYPILIMGVIAIGVIIERFRSLRMLAGDSSKLRDEVRTLLHEDRVEEALDLCDSQEGPVPAILAAGLRKYLLLRRLNYDPAKIEEQGIKAMDDYSVHVVAALEKHLPILGTVSSAAPMLGFLGTVAGMVVSFNEINARIGEENIVKLASGGISVALLTTAFGLIVGIPAFVAFNYFTGVINRFVLEVEESATELIEVVTMQVALQNKESDNGKAIDSAVAASIASK